jgi:hypothetical protein
MDVIFRGLLNVQASDMHHDQPQIYRLNEKQLSELEVIDEDQYSSLVKNAGKKDDASIPLKLDDESPILS